MCEHPHDEHGGCLYQRLMVNLAVLSGLERLLSVGWNHGTDDFLAMTAVHAETATETARAPILHTQTDGDA